MRWRPFDAANESGLFVEISDYKCFSPLSNVIKAEHEINKSHVFNGIALWKYCGVAYRSALNHFPGDNYTFEKRKEKMSYVQQENCRICEGNRSLSRNMSKLDFKGVMAIKRVNTVVIHSNDC